MPVSAEGRVESQNKPTRFSASGGSPPTRITGIFASKQKKNLKPFLVPPGSPTAGSQASYNTAYLQPEVFLVIIKKNQKWVKNGGGTEYWFL